MIALSRFKRLIEVARALSDGNRNDLRNHHVTFMLKKSRIVSIGINHPKTNTKNLKYAYFNRQNKHIGTECGTHSELAAIINYGKKDCTDITFVNIRIDRNGKVNNSLPCSGCSSLLKQVGFKKVYHTNSQGNFLEWTVK